MDEAPLILTLELDTLTQARFERERRQYFPAERNFVPAHVSMFHALPGAELEAILGRLRGLGGQGCPEVEVVGVRSLGRGAAYVLRSPGAEALRGALARDWGPWLGAQDRQGWRPHLTVQNKVSAEVARDTLARLQAGFAPWTAGAVAVRLWRYLGGPWEEIEHVALGAG